jgi:DNA mismatch repair protein MutH
MERVDAVSSLTTLVGQDLRQLADQFNVTVWSQDNKKNKGWAGHTISTNYRKSLLWRVSSRAKQMSVLLYIQ